MEDCSPGTVARRVGEEAVAGGAAGELRAEHGAVGEDQLLEQLEVVVAWLVAATERHVKAECQQPSRLLG